MQPKVIPCTSEASATGTLVQLRPLPPQTVVEPGETFGQALHRWRATRALSIRKLAALVHYSPSYVHELEHDKAPGSKELARQFDETLQTGGELVRLIPDPAEQAPMKPPPLIRRVAGREGWMVLTIGGSVLVLEPHEVEALRAQLQA